jgi:uncharacterized protein HemX
MAPEISREEFDRKERSRFVTTWAAIAISLLITLGGGLVAWGRIQNQIETLVGDSREFAEDNRRANDDRQRLARAEQQISSLLGQRADVLRDVDRLERRFDVIDAKLDKLFQLRSGGQR